MSTATLLPHWDLSEYFPSIESPEFTGAVSEALAATRETEKWFDENQIGGSGESARPDLVEGALTRLNALQEQTDLVRQYIYAHTSVDSFCEIALAKESETQPIGIALRKMYKRLNAFVGKQDLPAVVAASKVAADHAYYLEKATVDSKHQMTPLEEALAADLDDSGGIAWAKLHGNFTSRLMVKVALPSGVKDLPMSAVRNLAYEGDRAIRQAAYAAELAAWKEAELPLAASMNGIKGQVGLLAARRGWNSVLESTLLYNNIDMATLDAMLGAARNAFPKFRSYLRAKARLVAGEDRIAWYDLFAPAGDSRSWDYHEAEGFVETQFRTFSDSMGDLAARAYKGRWIDAEPRAGKRDGAFCMDWPKGASRVMLNFKPAFGSVSTLAHELGHAFHNHCLAGRTAIQRFSPMTVAETASIFCEVVVRNATLATAEAGERLAILDAALTGACQVVVDISSRFQFEKGVFERRTRRELSAAELCDAMVRSQEDTYGDGMNPELRHPYMWAVKPHYYDSEYSFYNYPYMFGLLFATGLYAVYQAEPEGFQARYEKLLSSTGLAAASALAREFGIDITTGGFWDRGLESIGRDVDAFVALVDQRD